MKAERILGALCSGQALGDAMRIALRLWPRAARQKRISAGLTACPAQKRIMPPAILTARSLRTIPQWRSAADATSLEGNIDPEIIGQHPRTGGTL